MATAVGPRVKSPFERCSRTQSFSHMQPVHFHSRRMERVGRVGVYFRSHTWPGPHCFRVAFPLGRYAGPIHRHSQGCQGQLAGACTAESNLFISSAWDYQDRTPCGSLCLKMSESMTLTPLFFYPSSVIKEGIVLRGHATRHL